MPILRIRTIKSAVAERNWKFWWDRHKSKREEIRVTRMGKIEITLHADPQVHDLRPRKDQQILRKRSMFSFVALRTISAPPTTS